MIRLCVVLARLAVMIAAAIARAGLLSIDLARAMKIAWIMRGASQLRARLSGSRRVEVAMITGGAPPLSEPCEALSPQGFHGVETQAVGAIARFINGAPAASGR